MELLINQEKNQLCRLYYLIPCSCQSHQETISNWMQQCFAALLFTSHFKMLHSAAHSCSHINSQLACRSCARFYL